MIKIRGGLENPAYAKRKKRKLYFKIVAFFVLFFTAFLSGVFVLRANFWKVKNIEVLGASESDAKDIEKFVADKISGNYFWFLPKSNFILSRFAVSGKTVVENFHSAREAEIDAKDLSSLEIRVSERKPLALWCKNSAAEVAVTDASEIVAVGAGDVSEDCYFMDDTGYIFSAAPTFSGSVYFKYYGLVEGEPLGQIYYGADFKKLSDFVSELNGLRDKEGVKLLAADGGSFEFVEKSGSKIIFSASSVGGEDFSSLFENVRSFFESPVFLKMQSEKNGGKIFDYADFRFGRKVFFK